MMKPCQPLWRAILFISFAIGFGLNPALSFSGIHYPRWFPLIGVFSSALFLLMLFLATPKTRRKENGKKKSEEPNG
jgi:hypothetical protein